MSDETDDSYDQRLDTQGLTLPLWPGLIVLGLFLAVLAIVAVVSIGRWLGMNHDVDADDAPGDSIGPLR